MNTLSTKTLSALVHKIFVKLLLVVYGTLVLALFVYNTIFSYLSTVPHNARMTNEAICQ